MNKFLTSNDSKWRLARTITQGILGVLTANIDLIVDGLQFDATTKTLIVGLVMAILSPIMAELGLHTVEIVTDDEIIEEAD